MIDMISHLFAMIMDAIVGAPVYHLVLEGILLTWVIWLIKRKKRSGKVELTTEEEDEIIAAWKPRPLVDIDKSIQESFRSDVWGIVQSRIGKYVTIDGKRYLNMVSHNYLGLVDDKALDNEAERCIRQYGVGSCGPRGFYGTVDVHLELEKQISKFMNLEETALYSYGFSTIASAIPSYAKNGDIIYADEFCQFTIQQGLQASRSTIYYFKHNDTEDLERLMNEQAARDKKNPKKAKTQRRFCVVEGIYMKTGQMCPLKEINALCRAHKVRLFLDESISFGAIGDTGRGVTEYLGVPASDIDFICGTMEYGMAAFGGFIVGSEFVVDHQRISGLGYCFSASLPPLLAGTGILALKKVDENPELVRELQRKCVQFHRILEKIYEYNLNAHELSPLKFLSLSKSQGSRKADQMALDLIVRYCKELNAIALIQPSYLEDQEHKLTAPCIRITVNRLLTLEDMHKVASGLVSAYNNRIRNPYPAPSSSKQITANDAKEGLDKDLDDEEKWEGID